MFEGTSGITASQLKAQDKKPASPLTQSFKLGNPGTKQSSNANDVTPRVARPSDAELTTSLSHLRNILDSQTQANQKLANL